MEVLQNRPNTAIHFSSAIQFENQPLLSYLAKKSAIWQQWLQDDKDFETKYFKKYLEAILMIEGRIKIL